MLTSAVSLLALAVNGPLALGARVQGPPSCSEQYRADYVNPCGIPKPGGLFVFRQRFEPDVGSDMGSWGIDGLEVLE
jgi:hypothetical protein